MNLIVFRHKISLIVIDSEYKSVADKMATSWNETTLPTILWNYKLEDLNNANQFGLFYQCLSNKTYYLQGKSAPKGKKVK